MVRKQLWQIYVLHLRLEIIVLSRWRGKKSHLEALCHCWITHWIPLISSLFLLYSLFKSILASNMVRMVQLWPLTSLERTIDRLAEAGLLWKNGYWPVGTVHLSYITLIQFDSRLSWFGFPWKWSNLEIIRGKIYRSSVISAQILFFFFSPSLLLHPHRGCLLLELPSCWEQSLVERW